jgi:hypothetical protein
MNTPLTIECAFHVGHEAKGRKGLLAGGAPQGNCISKSLFPGGLWRRRTRKWPIVGVSAAITP